MSRWQQRSHHSTTHSYKSLVVSNSSCQDAQHTKSTAMVRVTMPTARCCQHRDVIKTGDLALIQHKNHRQYKKTSTTAEYHCSFVVSHLTSEPGRSHAALHSTNYYQARSVSASLLPRGTLHMHMLLLPGCKPTADKAAHTAQALIKTPCPSAKAIG